MFFENLCIKKDTGGNQFLIIDFLLFSMTDSRTEMGKTVADLVEEGLTYLDTRTDFWRQQKPMYARNKDKCKFKRHSPNIHNSKLPPQDYIIKELEKIEDGNISNYVCINVLILRV